MAQVKVIYVTEERQYVTNQRMDAVLAWEMAQGAVTSWASFQTMIKAYFDGVSQAINAIAQALAPVAEGIKSSLPPIPAALPPSRNPYFGPEVGRLRVQKKGRR